MEFHDYSTFYQEHRRNRLALADEMKPKEWFEAASDTMYEENPIVHETVREEILWMAESRPYYSVWPAVIGSLERIKLDIDCSHIRLPLPQILLRFAVGRELVMDDGRKCRSILAAEGTVRLGKPGLFVLMDFGEVDGPISVKSYLSVETGQGRTVEQAIVDLDQVQNDIEQLSTVRACFRIVCGVALMAKDPSLIEPEVLSKDAAKFEETGDISLVERAVRRGKRGWSIGRRLKEFDPHVRRPHLALRWTEAGRSVPRIVAVKGSIVHRKRLTDVPTGYLDDEADDNK